MKALAIRKELLKTIGGKVFSKTREKLTYGRPKEGERDGIKLVLIFIGTAITIYDRLSNLKNKYVYLTVLQVPADSTAGIW